VKVLLFVLAVAFGLLALASRHHLDRELDPDDEGDAARVEKTLRSANGQKSLSDAFSRIQNPGASRPGVPAPAVMNQPGAVPAPAGAGDGISGEVAAFVKQMQENPEQAYSVLQRGLDATTGPDAAPYRLTLLQSALGIAGDENTIKDIALREMTQTIIEPAGPSADPSQVATVETKRMIVSTSFKLYLNASHDPETAYSDTQRVLSYQRDQSTKELLIYDCLSRFPELRERLIPNPSN
jgi:hypothetical protein